MDAATKVEMQPALSPGICPSEWVEGGMVEEKWEGLGGGLLPGQEGAA